MSAKPHVKVSPLTTFIATYFVWMLTLGTVILGSILLYVSSEVLKGQAELELWHDLSRDVGIAFIVAAIVAAIYELHARTRLDRETVAGVLTTVMNDVVDDGVWNETKSQIFEKESVRKEGIIKISIEENKALPPGQFQVWVQFDYKLCGLRSKPRRVKVKHFLDSFMNAEALKLPRFDQIVIGDETYKGEKLLRYINNGTFIKSVHINKKGDASTPVTVERHEIVYIPGSYNLAMGELTNGVRVQLIEVPDWISVEINMKSELHKVVEGSIVDCHKFFLPGQGIEFRFKPKQLATK